MARPRTYVAVGAALLLTASAGTGVALLSHGGTDAARASSRSTLATATVTRRTLQQAQTVPGTLGYGPAETITGRGDGTITWLPRAGAIVTRGEQLYRVDDAPVSLFYGTLPLYRTLSDHPLDDAPASGTAGDTGTAGAPGTSGTSGTEGTKPPAPPYTLPTGKDVDLVAKNLSALGFYKGPTVGARYDWTLAEAVEEWQESQGLTRTGILGPADIVVTGGPVRVEAVTAHLGDAAQEDVLSVTGTTKLITLASPVALARSLEPGRRVEVTLPDGSNTATQIHAIGAQADASDGGGPPTVSVTLVPLKPGAVARMPLGSVTARLVTITRKHVLSVPISALLALSGGGYAVERPDHTLVPVSLGMVASGRVEVTGIEAGARVVIAR